MRLRDRNLVRLAAAAVLVAAFIYGSYNRPPVGVGSDEAGPLVKTFADGPVSATLTLSASRITTAQRIEARLEVMAPEGSTVKLPHAGAAVGEFTLVGVTAAEPTVASDGRIVHGETYLLEPFLDGTYALGPLKFIYTTGPGRASRTAEIPPEPISIEVASVLAGGEDIPDIKDIAPLAELPPDRTLWLAAALAAAAVAVLGAVLIVLRRRRRLAPQPPAESLSDDEIALGELAVLLSEDLIQAGRIDEFYTRLTDILRRYVERRFGFHAPVQTTEQFLATIRNADAFGDVHRALLGAFLARCDLVKFASDRPGAEAIEGAVSSCRQFITETALGVAQGAGA